MHDLWCFTTAPYCRSTPSHFAPARSSPMPCRPRTIGRSSIRVMLSASSSGDLLGPSQHSCIHLDSVGHIALQLNDPDASVHRTADGDPRLVKPGKTFMRCLFEALAGVRCSHHHIRLASAVRTDILWWHTFMADWNGVTPPACVT